MSNFLRYKDYIGTVEYSNEDDVFYGKVFGINDLVNFEGDSAKKIKTAFKEDVDDYIETCNELNKIPQKSYKGSFNVRVPPSLHKDAAVIAVQYNISLNNFVEGAITYAVKHKQEIGKEIF